MPSTQRGCRCSRETYVAVKNVTRRPILFSQLKRRDGEGTINPEELFADDRPFRSEEERKREDELRALMSSIIDWAISFLSETNQVGAHSVFAGRSIIAPACTLLSRCPHFSVGYDRIRFRLRIGFD